jgi:hypothetical protein
MPTSKVILNIVRYILLSAASLKLELLGSKYYQNEERSETNPLVYDRKRENQRQRYQSYQGSNVLHFL